MRFNHRTRLPIRSYVLDKKRIEDARTGLVRTDVDNVLDGDIEPFIIAALLSDVGGGSKSFPKRLSDSCASFREQNPNNFPSKTK